MDITEQSVGNVAQLSLEGRFDANYARKVELAIRAAIEKVTKSIVLDLSGVPYIASAGLRVVLSMAKELRQQHSGDLRIAALQDNVKKVFEISGLDNVLRIFDDASSAAASFS